MTNGEVKVFDSEAEKRMIEKSWKVLQENYGVTEAEVAPGTIFLAYLVHGTRIPKPTIVAPVTGQCSEVSLSKDRAMFAVNRISATVSKKIPVSGEELSPCYVLDNLSAPPRFATIGIYRQAGNDPFMQRPGSFGLKVYSLTPVASEGIAVSIPGLPANFQSVAPGSRVGFYFPRGA